MNTVKLVKYNIGRAFEKRVSQSNIERRRTIAAMRGRVVALHATIRGEVDTKLAPVNAALE